MLRASKNHFDDWTYFSGSDVLCQVQCNSFVIEWYRCEINCGTISLPIFLLSLGVMVFITLPLVLEEK